MYDQIPEQIKEQLANAPKKPGVYIYRDQISKVIYVGKAVNLANRTRSYFLNYKRLDPRIQNMVKAATTLEYYVVDSEIEALLLETNLIKKYDPYFNVLMTDDKNYIWVKVNSELDFPIARIVREKKDDGADYFGPYPAITPIKRMLKNVRRVFKYRTCNRVIEERDDSIFSSDPKPCLYYHLNLCSAPCIGNQAKKDYRQNITNLKQFFRSEHSILKNSLEKSMESAAKQENYEKAATFRDQLRDLNYLTEQIRITEGFDEKSLLKSNDDLALAGLKELLLGLGFEEHKKLTPAQLKSFRIECYDISNIQGSNATSAMVVSIGGKAVPNLYRKFKIKSKSTPDDFAMLQETLTRRLKYLGQESIKAKINESFSQRPDLMLIDGGKGQVSSVLEILQAEKDPRIASIPCIGLAKREEEIILPVFGGDQLEFKTIHFSRRNPALKILQQIRDEAHRFGLGYHRLLRSKGMIYSQIDLIPGVGSETKKKLILAFGTIEGIKKAKLEDIIAVVKNRTTAMKIKKLLV